MFTTIPSATLRQLVKLSEQKEALMAKIQAIDRKMVLLQSEFGVPQRNNGGRARVTVSESPGRGQGKGRARRGALKEKIVKALQASGKRGTTIRELADKLNVRSANLYVWFNGTGKNVRGLKKVGPARYRLM
jgi:hypothetical protein